jgi:hypothetical protein
VGAVNEFPAVGNGFVLKFVFGKGSIPRGPFCDTKGLKPVGAGCIGLVWVNGESPVACIGRVLARKGFAPVICVGRKLGGVIGKGFDGCCATPGTAVAWGCRKAVG